MNKKAGTIFLAFLLNIFSLPLYCQPKSDQFIVFQDVSEKSCLDSVFTLNVSASSGLTVSLSIESGPARLSGSQLRLIPIDFTSGLAPATIIIRASQAGNNNYNPATDVFQSITIKKPSFQLLQNFNFFKSADTALCMGKNGLIELNTIQGFNFKIRKLSNGLTNYSPLEIINAGAKDTGRYNITAYEGVCKLMETNFKINVYNTTINGILPDTIDQKLIPYSLLFTPTGGNFTINGISNKSSELSDTTEGLYHIYYEFTSNNGCSSFFKKSIYVKKYPPDVPVFIYNAVTPNGDGKNDTFMIDGSANYGKKQVVISDSWGNLMYKTNDYKNEWPFKDEKAGEYFYSLKVNGRNYTGTFLIIR